MTRERVCEYVCVSLLVSPYDGSSEGRYELASSSDIQVRQSVNNPVLVQV